MPLKLMYITNNPIVASAADSAGIDWVFIDLEVLGKEERQPKMDTVKSNHKIEDINHIKKVLKNSQLLVRINPINPNSKNEIEKCIEAGADILMLPFFKTKVEVGEFIRSVNKRTKTCLLLETPEAVNLIDDILMIEGIDYIHVGLNDLHLGYNMKFMFELLSNGLVERLTQKFASKNIDFGFGGIAALGQGDLPAEIIIAEHYRLGSKMAILSRSFYKQTGNECDVDTLTTIFSNKLLEIREFEQFILTKDNDFLKNNKNILDTIVKSICERKKQ